MQSNIMLLITIIAPLITFFLASVLLPEDAPIWVALIPPIMTTILILFSLRTKGKVGEIKGESPCTR